MSSTEKTCTTAIVEEWDLMAFSAVRRTVDSHGTLYVVARVNSFEGNGNSESGRRRPCRPITATSHSIPSSEGSPLRQSATRDSGRADIRKQRAEAAFGVE